MNTSPRIRSSALAFTLIELLTVITIIAILMGLLFPAINIVKEQARKAEAKSAVSQVAAAVKQYYTEYGKYPIGEQTGTTDITYGENDPSNKELFDILRNIGSGGKPNQFNPRSIVFFEGKSATTPDAPRSGFDSTGAFMDPWGYQYRIIIDSNYDNVVTVPHSDFKTPNEPRTGCAAFSVGKDGILGSKDTGGKFREGSKPSDDIITWQ